MKTEVQIRTKIDELEGKLGDKNLSYMRVRWEAMIAMLEWVLDD